MKARRSLRDGGGMTRGMLAAEFVQELGDAGSAALVLLVDIFELASSELRWSAFLKIWGPSSESCVDLRLMIWSVTVPDAICEQCRNSKPHDGQR